MSHSRCEFSVWVTVTFSPEHPELIQMCSCQSGTTQHGMQPACTANHFLISPCQSMQSHDEEAASCLQQLVDDMAALLAGSALQLLGGACGSGAAAAASLQACCTSASSVKAERALIWIV